LTDDTLTTAAWVALITWKLAQGEELTTRQVAALGNRSTQAAYAVMCQISGCRGWPVYQDHLDEWKWKLCTEEER
jgi:hypothetical protein